MQNVNMKDYQQLHSTQCSIQGRCVCVLSLCNEVNPRTGSLCTMGKGHVMNHVVGNPYNPTEEWVTPCGNHVFHLNSRMLPSGGTWEFEQCIHCGLKRDKQVFALTPDPNDPSLPPE